MRLIPRLYLQLVTLMLFHGVIGDAPYGYGDPEWANKWNDVDEKTTEKTMDKEMSKKLEQVLDKNQITMMRSKKKVSYLTVIQDVHLGGSHRSVDLNKIGFVDSVLRWAGAYPWISIRKMTVMWKMGVSNNVRWPIKVEMVDRRDQNDDTRVLFSLTFPVSDNFIVMMAPGYTAHMDLRKRLLPWRFEFDIPEGEFKEGTKYGTFKIKLEVEQFSEATQVQEVSPIVRFTRVERSADEPEIRWMSKGKWYTATPTSQKPINLDTVTSARETDQAKRMKFLAFIGFDPTKLVLLPFYQDLAASVETSDLAMFEKNPRYVSDSLVLYKTKYQAKIERIGTKLRP